MENLFKALDVLPLKWRRWLFQRWFRLRRSLTLGVRALVLDDEGRVLLVRHTYKPDWMLPGGGVEKGETALQALRHELRDEVSIHITAEPQLFGVYSNQAVFPNDHVLLYVLRPGAYEQHPWRPNHEIAKMGFFAPDALPEGVTEGTRRRLREVLEGARRDAHW